MKKLFLTLIFALIMCVSFNSCTKNDFETINWSDVQKENFVKDFNTTFGVSQADYATHQWGMNFMPLVDLTANTTRGAYPNGNEWAQNGYTVPGDITGDERAAVLEVFNSPGDAEYTSLIDWEDFFVQQVYKGTKHYTAGNGGDVLGSDHMDWLCTVTNKKVNVVCWWPYEEAIVTVDPYDDHIFDFNNSNNNDYGGRMLMLHSNTNVFGYYNSEDSKVHYNFRMEKINGNYYVGFDFYGNGSNPNQQIARDYIYNDWIVKIVPATGVTPPSVDYVRVMCEDLGTQTSDFDYNDVVFDIKFIKNGSTYTADIILQAAGGTLPLTIGGYEVHDLFAEANPDAGIITTTMINTAAGRHHEYDPVPFTVTLPTGNYATAWDAINALPVIVLYKNTPIQLTITPGTPAEMFAVPTGTDWSDERVPIRNRYPAFVDWIRDSSITWWEE